MLLDKLLDEVITNDDYKRKDIELENKLNGLIEKERLINDRVKQHSDLEKRIEDISSYLKEEGTNDTNIKKLIEHISKLVVYQDHIEIFLDFYDTVIVNIDKNKSKNKLKTYQYVNTSKYLIPHTDKYRYEGKYKEVKVKVLI